jgi:CheY-like chemotaxis protein
MMQAEQPTRPSLLLVDDDAQNRVLLREALQANGFPTVGEAATGAAAVAMAEEQGPDVILMDLSMPTMGGLEATRLIKERLPLVQILVLTSYEGGLPEKSAENAGAYAYLVKGCSIDQIVAMIRQAWIYKRDLEERSGTTAG